MNKLAFVFPGQGSQSIGMGKSFCDSNEFSRRTFEEANDILGFNITRLCFEGPQAELDRTENTQPALLTASVAILRALNGMTGAVPSFLAGHSLGEYTAFVAAGSLSFADALRLVRIRGKLMQESVPEGTGKMCAILGLDSVIVSEICALSSSGRSVVVPANLNSLEQIVISGHTEAVDRAGMLAKEKGAKRVIPLQVSAPSHSPLMEKAAIEFAAGLEKIEFDEIKTPVITNVEAAPAQRGRVKELLTRQLTSPVRWVDIIVRMKNEGVSRILEVGPGKVLTGLVKRIEKDINPFNLSETGDMEKVLAELKGV